MPRSPTVPNASSARLAAQPAAFRRITTGHLAAIATALIACVSLLAFVFLHRSPMPEEAVLLASSTLAEPWHATSPLKSSL